MNTQSQDTARMTRIEAARQAALGTLSRARETLQVAATTVPTWARGVELKAGEQVDALLERVGLVRIARVEAKRPAAAETPAPSAPEAVEVEAAPEAVETEAPAVAAAAVAESVEASAESVEASAETTVESTEAAPESAAATESAGDRSSRRRRR